MTKEFVTYEQALALKELGFDEPCLRHYKSNGSFTIIGRSATRMRGTQIIPKSIIGAPLYQQAFRWFREKHDFYLVITLGDLGKYETSAPDFQCAFYSKNPVNIRPLGKYDTYEEAELECLKQLIKIVKEKI